MTHILIPRTPTLDLLRPFFECPTSELDQAWAAMVRIAEVQHARAGRQYPAQIEEPAAPAAVSPEHPPMPETWAVVASIEGQDVVCISSNALSGKGELTESEEQAVIGMAQHLLAFVGYGLPPCDFDPDDEPAPAPALEAPTPVQIQALHRARRAAQAQQKGPA